MTPTHATRGRRRRWPWLLGAAALALLVFADRRGWLLVRRDDDLARYHGALARVVRVIDGDTVEIDLADPLQAKPVTRVRLWGVDCAEPAAPDQGPAPWSVNARDHTIRAIGDGPVRLVLEPHRTRGVYGRVLAYIQASDGAWISEGLLQAGLARADERWPHARVRQFAKLQEQARQRGVGIWSNQ
ncbi:MAG: thermonuclease family protein [Planctomycetota bacterium]|jgi:endonuclease YncB( thermonuclease family)